MVGLPPVGAPLFGARVDIAPAGAQSIGTLALEQAFTLTGSVVRSGATPLTACFAPTSRSGGCAGSG